MAETGETGTENKTDGGAAGAGLLDVPENGGEPGSGGTKDNAGGQTAGGAAAGPENGGEFEFDKRLYTEDGKFNRDGAKEYIGGLLGEIDTHKKRADDMRRKLSGNTAPEKPE